MKSTWITRLGRSDALLFGASALALLASKAAYADTVTTATTDDLTVSADEAGSFQFAHNASITLNAGLTVAGVIDNTTAADGAGYLVFAGSATTASAIGGTNTLNSIIAGVNNTNVQFDGNVGASSIDLTSDGSLTFATGMTLSGNIDNTSGTASVGEVVFAGSGTIGGTIGATNTLSSITAGATTTNVQFDGNVGAAEIDLSSDGSVTFKDGVTVSGAINNTFGTDSTGEAVFAGSATVAGAIGATNTLSSITAGATTTNVQFDGNLGVAEIDLSSDGSITISDGVTVSGAINNTFGTDSTGEVVFTGSSTVGGIIGGTNTLSSITAGATTSNVQFDANVGVAEISMSSDGSITIKDGITVSGAINNTSGADANGGELIFAGSSTIGGAIGGQNTLTSITAGVNASNVQFDGNVGASEIDLTSDGSLTFKDGMTLSGSINNTSGTASVGEVVFAGSATIGSTIGATNTLSTLTAGATTTNVQFDGNVGATEIDLSSDGSITFKDGVTLSGNIVNTFGTDSTGEAVFAGSATVAGTIGGTNTLSSITAGATTTNVQFDGNLGVAEIDLSSDGSITIADGITVSGAINNTFGTDSTGEVVFAGSSTIGGIIGGTNTLSSITAGATTSNIQFDANVGAAEISMSSDGSITIKDGITVSGAINNTSGADANGGELIFAGSGTIGGAIGGQNTLTSITAGVNASNVQFDGNVGATEIDLTSDGSLTFKDGTTLSGAIDNRSGTASVGEVVFAGSTTVGGTIGATNTLTSLTAGATTTNVQFDGNVGVAEIDLSSDGSITFKDGVTLSGTINNTFGTDSTGEAVFAGSSTVAGAIGATNTLSSITAGANASNVQFDANIGAAEISLSSDGSITIASGMTVSGAINNTSGADANGGELVFAGSSTIGGAIGGQNTLTSITAGVNASNIQFDGNVGASEIDLTSDGSLTFKDGMTLSGAINNLVGSDANGEVVFAGSGTVGGAIGGTNTLSSITTGVNASNVQFDGNVGVTEIDLTSDGSLTFGGTTTLSGNIDNLSGAASTGEVVFAGSSTIGGTIGSTNTLSSLTAGATTTNVQFDGNLGVAEIDLSSDGSITFKDGVTLSGAINNTFGTDSTAEVVFAGSSTVGGNIGATNTLSSITAGVNASNVQFDGFVGAAEIDLSSDGSLTFKDGSTVSGAINNTVGADSSGEVVFAGSGTVGGVLGGTNTLSSVTAGAASSNVQFDGNVGAAEIDMTGAGSVTFAAGMTMSGNIDNTSGSASTGEVVFAGASTVGGNIGTTNSLSTLSTGVNGTTVQFDGHVTAAAIDLSSDGSVLIAADKTIGGTVTTSNASSGELDFGGNSTVSGDIGTSSRALAAVQTAANATSVQLLGDTYATTVTVNNNDSLSFAADKSISGAVAAGTNGAGSLSFEGNGTVTGNVAVTGASLAALSTGVTSTTSQIDGTSIYATAISMGAGTTKLSGSSPTLGGNVTLASGGTLELGTTTTEVAAGGGTGAVTFGGATSTLKVKVTDSTTYGALSAAGAVNMANGTIYVDMSSTTSYIPNSTAFTFVDATTGAALTNGDVTTTSTSAVLTFTSASTSNKIVLTATRASGGYAGVATGVGASVTGLSTALNSLGSSATGAMATLLGKLDAMNASQLGQTLTQLTPSGGNNSSAAAASSASSAVTSVISTRLASLQGHHIASVEGGEVSGTGMSSGDAVKNRGAWIQGIGSFADQGTRSAVDGYDSTTFGFAVGADTAITDKARIGLALSYANTQVDDKGVRAGSSTEVNSYQVNLYGTYDFTQNLFMDGILGFGLHDYDTKRVATLLNATANGSHQGYQYTAGTKVGYNVPLGPVFLTPFASAEYTNLSEDGYTETGTGGIPMKINSRSTDALKLGGGLRGSGEIKQASLRIRPEAHAGVYYDALASKVNTTAQFVGGGSSFIVEGLKPAATSYNAGLGVTVLTRSDLAISATYDAEIKDQFLGHTGSVHVRMPF